MRIRKTNWTAWGIDAGDMSQWLLVTTCDGTFLELRQYTKTSNRKTIHIYTLIASPKKKQYACRLFHWYQLEKRRPLLMLEVCFKRPWWLLRFVCFLWQRVQDTGGTHLEPESKRARYDNYRHDWVRHCCCWVDRPRCSLVGWILVIVQGESDGGIHWRFVVVIHTCGQWRKTPNWWR